MKSDRWCFIAFLIFFAVLEFLLFLTMLGYRSDNRFLNQLTADYEVEIEARMQDLEIVAGQRDDALSRIDYLLASRDQLEQELAGVRADLERAEEELDFARTPIVVSSPSEESVYSLSCWPVTSDPCLNEPTQEEFNDALLWCLDAQAWPISACINMMLVDPE